MSHKNTIEEIAATGLLVFFEYPTFATSLYLELFNVYSIAHYGAGRVLTASRLSRQEADGIIVEDSGIFHFLERWAL
jgi:hypothetical protein